MPATSLQLEMTDAAGDDLNDFVRTELISAQDSNHYQSNLLVRRNVTITGIEAAPSKVYRIVITPSNHRLVQFFLMLSDGQPARRTVAFPIDPMRVTGIQARSYTQLSPDIQRILALSEVPRFVDPNGVFLQVQMLYDALDATAKLKACLLNIRSLRHSRHPH